jgi:hypothetical protein
MRALVAVALLAGCIPRGEGEQELRTRVPGTWVGDAPDGTRLTMLLKPDGSGEVNGHAGTWEIKVGRVLLSDGERLVPCDLDGDELTCHTPEGDLVMRRADPRDAVTTTTPPEPAPEPVAGKPFVPEKTVPGQPFMAPADGPVAGVSFTVPDGWSHAEGTTDGRPTLTLTTAQVPRAGMTISRFPTGKANLRKELQEAIDEFGAGQQHHRIVLPAEDITIAGLRAGRAIFADERLEIYAATIVTRDAIFEIIAHYPVDQAEAMRPVVETVLGSFRASP